MRDATGPVRAVFPNQAFLHDVFHPRQQVVLYGARRVPRRRLQFTNPGVRDRPRARRDEDDATVHTGRIVPIYEKAGR